MLISTECVHYAFQVIKVLFRKPVLDEFQLSEAMFVVTASSRSEAGYERFHRPLRLLKPVDLASPISDWHHHY